MTVTVCITCDIDTELRDKNYLKKYLMLLDKKKVKATFFVNNEIIEKNPGQASLLKKTKHEIGAHGDTHTPFYGSYSELCKRLKKNKLTLEEFYKTKIMGFRAPMLKYSKELYEALRENGFRYSSNFHRRELISWVPFFGFTYELSFFSKIKPLLKSLADLVYVKKPKPYKIKGVLEIPVTTPCDWFLVDFVKTKRIYETWKDIFDDMAKKNGDFVFVVLTHPQYISNGHLVELSRFIDYVKMKNAELKTLNEITSSYS
ncbi:MAG: polysaccharide deacetylase family protein [Candidatus Nanoarchaeia archaeon]|nr:polysaccharide deacetylase family protein [Candidatus Nanoarchaeia archaeon]